MISWSIRAALVDSARLCFELDELLAHDLVDRSAPRFVQRHATASWCRRCRRAAAWPCRRPRERDRRPANRGDDIGADLRLGRLLRGTRTGNQEQRNGQSQAPHDHACHQASIPVAGARGPWLVPRGSWSVARDSWPWDSWLVARNSPFGSGDFCDAECGGCCHLCDLLATMSHQLHARQHGPRYAANAA